MAAKFKSVNYKPKDGGQLFTALSGELAGVANYVEKQDWRRDLDVEVRREGHEYFNPGGSSSAGEAFPDNPAGNAINLIHMTRRPNGDSALIVGTETNLYRYMKMDDAAYVDSTYMATSNYFVATNPNWIKIGSGFTNKANGAKRWQAVNLNGYTVLNNGYDLPVVYRSEDHEAVPIYELRESGVSSVGCIASYNGILMLGDITEVSDLEHWKKLNSPTIVKSTAVFQTSSYTSSGITVTAASTSLYSGDVITFSGGGVFTLSANAALGATTIFGTLTEATIQIGEGGQTPNRGTYGKVTTSTARNHARLIWSQINNPKKFSASNKGSITAGSTLLTLDYETKSYSKGDQITIIGAGTSGGNLTVRIGYIDEAKLYLHEAAITTVTSALVSQTSEANSIVGYEDIEDDGSGIINMAPLQNSLAIYKDTSIFIAEYTGSVTAPFKFRLIKVPDSKTLYYKNSLISVKESVHIYAGRDNFYAFDLSSRGPKELIPGQAVKDLFYDVVDITKTDDVFAADNVLTNEIWFGLPASGAAHKSICLDYISNTISTTAVEIGAAASIKKPPNDKQNWFIMGTKAGAVLRYGLTNETQSTWSNKKAIYYRMQANPYSATQNRYDSTIKSGLADFGDAYNEKDLRAYVVQLASQQDNNATLNVKVYGYENPYDDATTLTGSDPYKITNPKGQNLIPVFFRQHLYQDEIMVNGTTNVRLAGRIFDVSKIKSSSEVRTPAIA
jgi:hypothetical protein